MRLKDRVAIATGGGVGTGRVFAVGVVGEGASVVIADLAAERAETAATEIREAGGEAIAVAVDVTDEVGVEAMARAALDRYGRIDILVNNAAMFIATFPRKPFWELTVAE